MEPDGLAIIAVDVSNDVQRTRQFYDENGFSIPAAFDPGQEISARAYGVIATPTNYLLDKRGRIVWRHYGYKRGDEADVRREIRELLAKGN